MERTKLNALLNLAGIEPAQVYQLANDYWPDCDAYAHIRRDNPWWLVLTAAGPIVIGWRKRVISIDWRETAVREVVTEDDVTKDETSVHAWSYAKAVEYLTQLRSAMSKPSNAELSRPAAGDHKPRRDREAGSA